MAPHAFVDMVLFGLLSFQILFSLIPLSVCPHFFCPSCLTFLPADEVPFYANSDERIVELQGEALKVLQALEAVVGHLRKFLVDQSVLPLFEKIVSGFCVCLLRVVDYGTVHLYFMPSVAEQSCPPTGTPS